MAMPGGDLAAVGADRNRPEVMTPGLLDRGRPLPASNQGPVDIPEADQIVARRRREALPVGCERDSRHPVINAASAWGLNVLEGENWLQAPAFDKAIQPAGHKLPAVRCERDARRLLAVAAQGAVFQPGAGIV